MTPVGGNKQLFLILSAFIGVHRRSSAVQKGFALVLQTL